MLTMIVGYLLIINALGFLLMQADKQKARKNLWRIPEATLLTAAALGGSIGTLLGMYTIRHKTKHLKFTLGVPAILIAQIALTVWILTLL
ncbi:MAG: DUF1294 domain-containing protein [Oscillospiraceae bacterium]|nr:DUF1294 domain-containing protein [Oscillospiraceae bacterium]